jgi:hypothetical protein
MKKVINIVTILILSLSLISCSASKSNKSSNNSNIKPNTTTNNTTSSGNNTNASDTSNNTNIPRAKEITYLPAYNSDMKADSFFPADKNNKLSMGIYTIKSTTSDEVFQNYEKILKSDGWNIYQDVKDHSISAKKGTHDCTIIIQQSNKDVKLTISSK